MTRKPRLERTSREVGRSIAATPRADFLLINGPEIYIKASTANQAGGGIGTKLPTRKHHNGLGLSADEVPIRPGSPLFSKLTQIVSSACREPPVEFCDREFSRAGNHSSIHHRRLPGMCLASGRGNIMIAMTISSSSLTTGYSQIPGKAESLGLLFPACCAAHLHGIVQQ